MALWIKATNVVVVVTPKNGRQFTLPELQGFVGRYIEAVPLSSGQIMWLTERRKLKRLPFNGVATAIAHEWSGIARSDSIVGDVLIASRTETGEEEQIAQIGRWRGKVIAG